MSHCAVPIYATVNSQIVSGSPVKLVSLNERTTYLCAPICVHPDSGSDSFAATGSEVRTCPRAPRTTTSAASSLSRLGSMRYRTVECAKRRTGLLRADNHLIGRFAPTPNGP